MKSLGWISTEKIRVLMPAVIFYLFLGIFQAALPAEAAGIYFTREEGNYLAGGKVLRAVSIDGAAPLHYRDSKGEIKGIAVNVLHEITEMTGLIFEYELYDSINDALGSDADIVFGVSKEYATKGVILSKPYLYSQTILFYNSSLVSGQLEGKRYAAIEGGTLPQGIKEEDAIYYDNREDTMDAVERGKADYGFGNEYSLAFYMLQNGYKNIITVPTGKETRAYCLGLIRKDEVLLSIINKSIEAIDVNHMQTLILDVASQVERKITVSMVFATYGKEIFSIVFLAIAILLHLVFSNIRANKKLGMENKRHEILSHISNECLFEYLVRTGKLEMSGRFDEKFALHVKKYEAIDLLKNVLAGLIDDGCSENVQTLEMPRTGGDIGVFKIVCSIIYDGSGKPYSVVGKLIDISEEVREKEKLLSQSQLDGMTGLYNATATRELITAVIKEITNKGGKTIDVFAIIDGDKFKNINDTFGHLKGDLALVNIGKALRLTFRQTDILGRIGGDEFCVYMHNVPSVDFARAKCLQLLDLIQKLNEEFQMAVSIGIAILGEGDTYEELFKRADAALYHAKSRGGAQVVAM